MGFSEKMIAVGGAAAFAYRLYSERQRSQETKRRKDSPLRLDETLTAEDFEGMAREVASRTPRVRSLRVRGMEVTLVVRSNSGLTAWESVIDFNDYGALTGRYWLQAENTGSLIPEHFAGALRSQINARRMSTSI